MHAFLLLAVPFGYGAILSFWANRSSGAAATGGAVAKGALIGLVVVVLLLLVPSIDETLSLGVAAYAIGALRDFYLPAGIAVALFFVVHRAGTRLPGSTKVLSLASFLAGAFAVLSVFDLLTRSPYFSAYELYLLPALRVALIVLLALLFGLADGETMWIRYLYVAAMVLLPAALAVVPYLMRFNHPAAGIVLTTFFVASTTFLFVIDLRTGALRRGYGG